MAKLEAATNFEVEVELNLKFIYFEKMRSIIFVCLLVLSNAATYGYERKELIDNRIDPELNYHTIQTPHFEIHYPNHLAEAAQKISEVSEKVYLKVRGYFGWDTSEVTHIVVSDRSDQISLFTIGFPHKQIYFDVSLPPISLGVNEYGDWYEWLLTHEFSHVYQLERKGPLFKSLAFVFGSTAQPNMAVPVWFKEGQATYLETKLTGYGRGDGSFYRMYIRQSANTDDFKLQNFASLDTINNHLSPTWPWTLRAYLLGFYLVKKMETHSPKSVELVEDIANSFPFSFESSFERVFKKSLTSFWNELLEELRVQAVTEIKNITSKPLTPLKYLTTSGYYKNGLTISPNGKWLLTTQVSPIDENRIVRLNLDEMERNPDNLSEEFVVERSTGSQISFSKSSRYIAFDRSARAKEYNILTDIVLYDLKEKRYASVSPNIRARDPDIHPNGKELVFVLNLNGKNRLFTADSAWNNPIDLSGDIGFSRISTPRYSDDGKKIIMSIHNDLTGGEDIVVYQNGQLETVIANGALNFSPVWLPNKNKFIFSSDMVDGVFNIFTFDLDTLHLKKMTNVIGGLFYPTLSPDLKKLYCVSYHSGGYDIAEIAFDTLMAESISLSHIKSISYGKALEANDFKAEFPVVDYRGVGYLKPMYLAPSLFFIPGTLQMGATLGSVDPLFFHHYEFTIRHDSSTNAPVGSFYYFNGASENPWDLKIQKQSYLSPKTKSEFQNLSGQLGLTGLLKSVSPNLSLRTFFDYQKNNFKSETVNYGPGISLYYDSEFTQIGLSFPESGIYSELAGTYYHPGTENADSFTELRLKLRSHFSIEKRTVYHASLDSAAILKSKFDGQSGILIGSKMSFPYMWNSGLNLYGYPVNEFVAKTANIFSQRITTSFKQVEKFLSLGPTLYLQRLSGAAMLQIAALNTVNGPVYPASAGLEIYQDFNLGQIFALQGSLGVYRGETSTGGETQIILSFDRDF